MIPLSCLYAKYDATDSSGLAELSMKARTGGNS